MFNLVYYIAINFSSSLVGFLAAHFYESSIVLLGIFGYFNAKRTYMNNLAPLVLPTKIDVQSLKITVQNVGRGHAQNIQTPQYTRFVDFGKDGVLGKGIHEWKLSFEDPTFLQPNEIKELNTVTYVNNEKRNSDLVLYANLPKKGVKFLIEYQDIDGTRYITSSFIEDNQFKAVKVERDYFYMFRTTREYVMYWCMNLYCRFIEQIRRIPKVKVKKTVRKT